MKTVVQILTKDDNTLVRTIQRDTPGGGSGSVEWDGKDDRGVPVPAGAYTVQVTGLDQLGNDVGAESRLTGRVRGMRYKDGVPMLLIGGLEAPLAQLDQVIDE